jgi:rhodanese-related sulfurtransferase
MKTLLTLIAVLGSLIPFGIGHAQEQPPAVEHVSATEAQKLVADKEVRVLDVRTPAEFAAGHIAGAVNVDFRAPDFEEKIAKLDKTPRYVVHCSSGNRSEKALPLLQKHGFQSIYHLDGGFIAWEKAGLPMEK